MTTANGKAAEPPDADTRFTTYLADVAARVNDPTDGEVYRMILDDGPQEQRALFDLAEALAANPAPPAPGSLVAVALVMLVLTAVALVAARHLT